MFRICLVLEKPFRICLDKIILSYMDNMKNEVEKKSIIKDFKIFFSKRMEESKHEESAFLIIGFFFISKFSMSD